MKRIRTRESLKDQSGIAVVGERGAMELWWLMSGRHLGGVEAHYREPTAWLGDEAKHESCPALDGAPCWHDGTSLWALEFWLPFMENCGEEATYDALERHYSEFMGVTESEPAEPAQRETDLAKR